MSTCGTSVRLSAVSAESKQATSEEMMERLTHWIEALHQHSPDSVGDLLHFRAVSCDPATGEYQFHVETAPWMQNAFGSLHGGIIATALDQGMGMLATCLTEGKGLTPTVQLNLTYHRPILPGNEMLLKVYVVSMTKTLIHMRSEVMQSEQPDKLCVSAVGIFYFKPLAAEKEN